MRKYIPHVDLNFVKEDYRRMAVNLTTLGIVGLVINHPAQGAYTSYLGNLMLCFIGSIFHLIGIKKGKTC